MGDATQHPGSIQTRAWARTWPRRALAGLAGAVLLTALARPAALAAPAANPGGSSAATVSIDSLSPAAPASGDTLTINGTVTNDGATPMTALHMDLHLATGGPLGSRSAISNLATQGDYSYTDGNVIPNHTARLPELAPHASGKFTLAVPMSALALRSSGVYQIGVTASGSTATAAYDHVLGIERTFLPWYGGGGQQDQTTFLWPLMDRPHLDIRSPGGDEPAPLFRDDELAAELAPGGRLQQLVQLGKDLPVTWVIDPELLASVDAMTQPYRVVAPNGTTTAGTGSADARKWLAQLQTAVKGRQVIAVPFGDPDLASIAHHGLSVPGTVSRLKPASQLAALTVQTILGVTPTTDVAWPVDGALDPSIVTVAKAAGASKIIARSDTFPDPGIPYTPTAARPIGDGETALVADATLSNAFTGDLNSPGAATAAEQQFLAQSLMIHEEAPAQQRSILVAPQRNPSAAQARAMAAAISGAVSGGWAHPVDLSTAAAQHPDPGVSERVPSAGAYPEALRRLELGTSAFWQMHAVQRSLNGFLVILTRKDRVTTPFGNAILEAFSTEWRAKPHGAAAFRDDITDYLSDLVGYVRIIPKQSITLSGRTATIPVTVQNSLTQQVSGLRLRLTSTQPNRLDPSPPQPVTIDGGHSHSMKFRTTARANGKALLTAQLYTADGTPYGQPMVFQVDVTSITDTVMLVIAGGLLLLVLAGVRMYGQRKRRAQLAVAEDDAPDSTPTASSAAAATPPADPAGTAPPGTGSDTAPPDTASDPADGDRSAAPDGPADPADAPAAGSEHRDPATRGGPPSVPEQPGARTERGPGRAEPPAKGAASRSEKVER